MYTICSSYCVYCRFLFYISFFLSEVRYVYDLFQLLCIVGFYFICFPPEVIFRSRVVGACPVTL